MDTPYQWVKQIASHWGGTRNGMIVHWPSGIAARGEVRTQFHHVIDVAPTLLEAARLPAPIVVEGVQQKPIEGTSMLYTFEEPGAPERHDVQYFEMFGNRGIYHKGWTAVTRHGIPWELVGGAEKGVRRRPVGALRHAPRRHAGRGRGPGEPGDPARAAAEAPHRGRAPRRAAAGRPARGAGHRGPRRETHDRPRRDAGPLRRHARAGGGLLDIKNRSHAITAEIEVPEDGAQGVILAQGTQFGGYALYAPEGRLKYVYNFLGLETFTVEAPDRLSPGTHQVRMEFDYDGGGLRARGAR
jgi:hypothetical protein